jgi:hypothetical protein
MLLYRIVALCPNQQDPSKKNPSHGDDSRQRDGEEGSEQLEKRRAS